MTLASDNNLNDKSLSPTAQRMLALRDMVLAEWEKRLRATVREAASLPHPILINTFPTLYDNIAEAISPGYPRDNAVASNTVASEHGGERARLTDYSHQAVIAEYQLLRWVILDMLNQHGVPLDAREFHDINASIDACIQESVNAFALAQSALRERFIITVTHDLRNPLQVINSAAELLLLSQDPARIGVLAKRIVDNSQRMDRMIQDLLDAAVFQSGERLRLHLDRCDILAIVRDVCDQLVEVYGQRFEIVGAPVEGWWDRDAMRRVVENLVGNALKYGKPDAPIRITMESQHARMLLTVHNEGEPIPAEQLETVFQVFRRAEEAKEGEKRGWGIGLPYVRSVAESHGGSVQLDSGAGRGTTLAVDIPVDARPYQNAPTLGGG
jgi:signal transduction histidine kinase